MCIAFIAVKAHPRYPLIVLANRDEFLARPTLPMHRWEGQPTIIAGRDLLGGGTWFGVNDKGRMALLTNYREPPEESPERPSRGELIPSFLRSKTLTGFESELRATANRYAGFNLVYGPVDDLRFFSNRGGEVQPLSSGIHGLSNALLNTPWPKVERGKALLREALQKDAPALEDLWAILDDGATAGDDDLPETGVPLEIERRLSSIRIPPQNGYGSVSATVVMFDTEGVVRLWERPYGEGPILSFTLPLHPR